MRNLRGISLGTVVLVLLCACGQKGRLYRPDQQAEPVAPTSETAPANTQPDKKKSPPIRPAPQTQKEDQPPLPPPPAEPGSAAPAVDPDRPATPPPGT